MRNEFLFNGPELMKSNHPLIHQISAKFAEVLESQLNLKSTQERHKSPERFTKSKKNKKTI